MAAGERRSADSLERVEKKKDVIKNEKKEISKCALETRRTKENRYAVCFLVDSR